MIFFSFDFQSSQIPIDNNLSSLSEPQPMEIEITRELPPLELPPVTFDHIRNRLHDSYVNSKYFSFNENYFLFF